VGVYNTVFTLGSVGNEYSPNWLEKHRETAPIAALSAKALVFRTENKNYSGRRGMFFAIPGVDIASILRHGMSYPAVHTTKIKVIVALLAE